MPSRIFSLTIVVFWLATTAWLFVRDVAPTLGYSELDYRTLLADRAVERSSRWSMRIKDQEVGSVVTTVKPQMDGSHSLITRASLGSQLWNSEESSGGRIYLSSRFDVAPLGGLDTFEVAVRFDRSNTSFRFAGHVEGNELVVRPEGLPIFDEETRVPIDPDNLFGDRIGPVDRLPGLRLGRTWTTRTVDALAALPSPTRFLEGGGPPVEVVLHEVVAVETIEWAGSTQTCFRIDHRTAGSSKRSMTWARQSDGLVLRTRTYLGGLAVTLELEPEEPMPGEGAG